MLQSPSPASLFEVSDGAYQFCIGMRPPWKASDSELPPSALMAVWHMPQWPNPSTRYAPLFHSSDWLGLGLNSPSLKKSVRQPRISDLLLYGNFRSCGRFG